MKARTIIEVTGRLTGPWAVAAAAAQPKLAKPITRNPLTNEVILPTTTMVGSLVAHLERIDPDSARGWFGGDGEQDPTGAWTYRPSRLWASPVQMVTPPVVERVTRTAIDAARGAADAQTLRTAEVAALRPTESTEFRWLLIDTEPAEQVLLERIAAWNSRIGSAQSTGQGALSVTAVRAFTVDLHESAGLTWWLSDRHDWIDPVDGVPPVIPAWSTHQLAENGISVDDNRWQLMVLFNIVDPLHVGSGEVAQKKGRETKEKLILRRGGVPQIPGSAWKGIFRHRCKFILQAMGAAPSDVAAVIRLLFGHGADSRAGGAARGAANEGRRGLLFFAGSDLVGAGVDARTHVAIDRITGGAADKLLYSKEFVTDTDVPLSVSGPADLPEAVQHLLGHVVWDLHEGVIGIGGGTTRGYGTLQVTGVLPVAEPVDLTAVTGWAKSLLDAEERPISACADGPGDTHGADPADTDSTGTEEQR